MTTIFYNDGGCGSGKTHQALQAIVTNGGRHIYAADRIEAIEERARELRDMRPSGSPLTLITIYSNHDFRGAGPSVQAQIEAVPTEHGSHRDLVVFITHEAMKHANFDSYADHGWTIWIDEVPSVLDHDAHSFYLSWERLAEIYELKPLDKRWSEITLLVSAIDVAALAHDDAFQVLRPFHRRVADPRRTVLADLTAWSELGVKRRTMSWHSLWSPEELAPFDNVFMLGNSLKNSLTYQLWQQHWPEVQWVEMSAPLRPFLPRRVTITCFAEGHTASRKLFGSDKGQDNLKRVARYLGDQGYEPQSLIWTCNHADRKTLRQMPGTWLAPKKAGSNSYEGYAAVAALYSAKPSDSHRLVLDRLGVDAHWHTVTAEYETVLQFACRGSIRLPGDQQHFRLFVYDRDQAEHLAAYFRDDPRGYVLWPEVVVENLGFAFDVRDTKRGRKPKPVSLAEDAAKKAKRNEDAKLRMRNKRAAAQPHCAALKVMNISVDLQPKRA